MNKVRLVAFVLQLEIVTDDGDMLAPMETPSIRFPAAAWPPDIDTLVEKFQRQVDAGQPQP